MTNTINTKKIVAAFESWHNGGVQVSALHIDDVASFIEAHYQSGTFATLHTFDSIDEATKVYEEFYL